MAETTRAYPRRLAAGYFEKYITGNVIDVGVGRFDTFDGADPVTPDCVMHDKDICDATTMEVYDNDTFDCVHASHILEHLNDPMMAIRNWYRICKPGGHIIITVPHRDLYERQRMLPSRWNRDHKTMWLPDRCDPPHAFNFHSVIVDALKELVPGPDVFAHIVSYETFDTCTNHDRPNEHPDGDMCIEAIIRK